MSLLARSFEGSGIATVVLTEIRDVMERAKPPRGVFVNFPLGHPLGRPLDVNFQMKILKETLGALTEMGEPGKIKDLPYRWSEDFSWRDWLSALVSYLDKKKSKVTITEVWHDEKGKTHRRVKYKPVPGWE